MSEVANILLVDDEPGMLRYIRTLLEVDEHKVQTASTGEEAVECVEKGLRPDLVLLDLMMPVLDGWDVLRVLRGARPDLPVIVLSALTAEGGTDYFPKPLSFQRLSQLLESIHARLAWPGPATA